MLPSTYSDTEVYFKGERGSVRPHWPRCTESDKQLTHNQKSQTVGSHGWNCFRLMLLGTAFAKHMRCQWQQAAAKPLCNPQHPAEQQLWHCAAQRCKQSRQKPEYLQSSLLCASANVHCKLMNDCPGCPHITHLAFLGSNWSARCRQCSASLYRCRAACFAPMTTRMSALSTAAACVVTAGSTSPAPPPGTAVL